jgi:putative membrane protein
MLKRWLLHTLAVIGASAIAQAFGLGFKAHYDGVGQILVLMIGVAILGFLNATLGTILKLFTLPVVILSLGLFALVINAVVLLIAGSLEIGFTFVEGSTSKFWTAFLVSIIIAILNGILNGILGDDKDREDR